MAKWRAPDEVVPEVSWASSERSPHLVAFMATPNRERPWLINIVIATSNADALAFSLHRDDARSLGYALEEHDWHAQLVGWDEDGILEPEGT